jgi:hypothetical protein
VRLAAAALAALVLAPVAGARVPPLPHGWPATMQIGLADSPGGAAALRAAAPFGFRYQYLAGGVNTGQGWSTWNPDGTFASMYAQDSWAHQTIPVLTYYMLLQSKPGGGDEAKADLGNLQNAATMGAYWDDVRLLFKRIKSTHAIVVHVEPDLWGYMQQVARHDDAATVPGAVPFAQAWVKLRNQLAPNAILAWHMSGWGTKHDIVYEDPNDATVVAYAKRSARFYRSLHARFDLSFEDYSDRDAGFYEHQQGNPRTWFTPADFHRHLLYGQTFVKAAGIRMAAWQIPLGNTVSPVVNDTWGHYRDNRVEWLLGPDGRAHLRAYARAGYVGFLFGGGAAGTTCACDSDHDGVDDDGGYFKQRSRAYYAAGALQLPK